MCALRGATSGYNASQTEVAILRQGCHWSSAQLGAGGSAERSPRGCSSRREGVTKADDTQFKRVKWAAPGWFSWLNICLGLRS